MRILALFVDCSSLEAVGSDLLQLAMRLGKAGSWGHVYNGSELHRPASPPAVCVAIQLLENVAQVGESFYPVTTFILTIEERGVKKTEVKKLVQ